MRIAFVVYGSLDNVSGGFIYDRALVGALRARGHEVDEVGLPWHGYARAVAGSVLGGRLRRRAPPAGAIYDAVIEDELVHPSLFRTAPGTGGRPGGRVTLALVHNLASGQPGERAARWKARVERRYFSTVGGVLAVCARTLADVRALAGAALPAAVVHPGRDHLGDVLADERLVDARSAEPGPLRVLHVAAVQPHKGLQRLLDALVAAGAGAGQGGFTLDVVGSLADRRHARAIRRQVARLGLQACVRLHGEQTGADLQALFARCQVLALPSDREAYSLACLEALGFGLPVLATSRGGLDEMISSGREGFLLDPHDTGAWARALAGLGTDRRALAAMSRAALARHRAHAPWRAAAAAVEAFIQARLAAAAPAPATGAATGPSPPEAAAAR